MILVKEIKKFFRESLYLARLANSQNLEADNKIVASLDLLNKYEYIASNPSSEHIEYFLIRSRLYYKLGNFQNALDDTILSQELLKNVKKIYNDVDSVYLKKYTLLMLSNIYYSLNDTQWQQINNEYENMNISIEINSGELNQLFLKWLPL